MKNDHTIGVRARCTAVVVGVMFAACGVEGLPRSRPLVSCLGGQTPFATDVLSAPPIADDDHPAVRFVRRAIGVGNLELRGFPADGELRLLSDTGDEAEFALGDTSVDFPTIRASRHRDGWRMSSSSNCQLVGWARGRKASPWSVRGNVDPTSTRLSVLVEETACASGRTAEGRIDPPTIEWSDRVAIVTIAVRPAPGNQTCPSNPPTPFTVELPGPLGWRTLLDGSHVPPAPPGTRRQPV